MRLTSAAAPIQRIVLTGAAGRLGRALTGRLAAQLPLPIVGIDRAPDPGLGIDYLQAELSDTETVAGALRPGDLLVHVAAIHGLSAGYPDLSYELYFDLNCKGTWSLYTAAARAGVRKAILTSTIGSLGADPDPAPFKPYTGFESYPASMGIYALSKRVQEEIAATFAHYSAISTVVLRPPAFVALEPVETGLMLTKDYLTIDDILDAHVAAADATVAGRIIDSPDGVIEQIFVANLLPYQPSDSELIAPDGNFFPVVRKYWPGAADWLAAQGYVTQPETSFLLFSPTRLPMMASPERARSLLGWTPKTTFDAWFKANVS
jgi:nucleoside-diphosphate-sugar epimerase